MHYREQTVHEDMDLAMEGVEGTVEGTGGFPLLKVFPLPTEE